MTIDPKPLTPAQRYASKLIRVLAAHTPAIVIVHALRIFVAHSDIVAFEAEIMANYHGL
jgi:hypothetical protein